ncbi:hypothetical protein TWF730_008344 [Orbilia blumenaviensis]|uniref:Uncharacterized protein n=1 Tax=Orbilia blumenaviensis TaxID=1796055 RepID=A0AAV9V2T4_9PEZI
MKGEMQVQRQIRRENDEYLRGRCEEEVVPARSLVEDKVAWMLGHLSLIKTIIVNFWPILLYINMIGLSVGFFMFP